MVDVLMGVATAAALLDHLPGGDLRGEEGALQIDAENPVILLFRGVEQRRPRLDAVVAFWAWHAPALYDLALRSDFWHHVEHACFFTTALLFWRPVILAWPARSPWPRWAMIPYLVLAELQNTMLAAILTFSDRVIYPAYGSVPRLWGIGALEDQSIAGAIMWVPGSLAFLLPVLWLVVTGVATPKAQRNAVDAAGGQAVLRSR